VKERCASAIASFSSPSNDPDRGPIGVREQSMDLFEPLEQALGRREHLVARDRHADHSAPGRAG